ncbi:Integration host factor subunit beta [Dirofilaria immitis]
MREIWLHFAITSLSSSFTIHVKQSVLWSINMRKPRTNRYSLQERCRTSNTKEYELKNTSFNKETPHLHPWRHCRDLRH